MFNELGKHLTEAFPNIEIIGNYDKPKYYGAFEVYVRGIGPTYEQDEEGRLFLFKNHSGGSKHRYPNFASIYETLVLFAMDYGDSNEMERAQDVFMKRFGHKIPPRFKDSHPYPHSGPEVREHQHKGKKE